jgi:hypothetical protein
LAELEHIKRLFITIMQIYNFNNEAGLWLWQVRFSVLIIDPYVEMKCHGYLYCTKKRSARFHPPF